MNGCAFVVDRNLVILSFEAGEGFGGGNCAAECVGLPYYEVFSRILRDRDDAVELVIRHGRPILLKGYRGWSLFGAVSGDVSVSPVSNECSEIVGAEVRAAAYTECILPHGESRRMREFEMGKKSVTLAHGVRSPLNAIKGAAVFLKGKYRNEPALVEFMDIIEDEISKLDRFVTKFLSTSLLESEFVPVDVEAMIRRIVSLVSLQADGSNIVLNCDLQELPPVRADECLLEHAVLNVVNNSLEAVAGGGSVRVAAKMELQDGRKFVSIEVSDNGSGISESRLRDISNGLIEERNSQGRGFGLFITREVVRYHGGRLEIESRKKSGTRVRILVPVAPQ